MSNHLIVGMGQIGTALMSVLKEKYTVNGIERTDEVGQPYDVMHVTFPCKNVEEFKSEVRKYQKNWLIAGGLTIIHSTVPVGVCDELGVVHSPVRGIHPNLREGILTFSKFFGGKRAKEAADVFAELGINVVVSTRARDVEAMKLWDTTQYGVNISLMRRMHEWCEENDVNFDVAYTLANESYNAGYEALGHPEYKKYILKYMPGKVGGHCVIQNLALLKEPAEVVDFVLKKSS